MTTNQKILIFLSVLFVNMFLVLCAIYSYINLQ